MNLTLERPALLAALDTLGRLPHDGSLPILACVRLEARDGLLRLHTTDLDVHLQTEVPALISSPGTLCVSLDRLTAMCRALPERDITFAAPHDESNRLTLTASGARFELSTLSAEEFPPVPTMKKANAAVVLPVNSWKQLLGETLFCMST